MILVREEYVSAYEIILINTLNSTTQGLRSATLVIGHPGIASSRHVIHTGSPSSRWKNWVKRLGARKFFMDVWSLEEFQTRLALNNLDFPEGKVLFEKNGPSSRNINILTKNIEEDTHESEINAASTKLAEFSKVFPQLEDLDDFAFKIITVRPHTSRVGNPSAISPSYLRLSYVPPGGSPNRMLSSMLSGHPSFRAV
ncbi:hypothetical protein AX14_013069 [Amanita brunnescens Koide BX004]|nr:hypothetical protein AX14_013069 [Amanita brunnescens Koide BX004]